MKKLSFFFFMVVALVICFKARADEDRRHMYVRVQKLYYHGHTYIRFMNTWSEKGDITVHDPDCACGEGWRKMKLDSLEYDMNIPISKQRAVD